MSALFGIWHGPRGLKDIATRVRFRTELLATQLEKLDIKVVTDSNNFFDTIAIDARASDLGSTDSVLAEFHKFGINLRKIDDNLVGLSMNEYTTIGDLAELIEVFAMLKEMAPEEDDEPYLDADFCNADSYRGMPENLSRKSDYMTQQVFNTLTSETEFMRYIHKLGDKDMGLAHGMIPLGSCTMKLNSAIVMAPITFEGFANVHPFAPRDQIEGYMKMIKELEDMLVAITHYDTISLQPNSGANGEFAGLMAIKKYHESRGEGHRNICLIPTSAHGTNPATAVMCGMKVVPVICDERGNMDVEDVRKQIAKHSGNISSSMITYPSTHGVFESAIKEICEMIHEDGGQIYMDGANLNAQLGLTSPGLIGADVGHLNLHKTFAIPHGGGGPGVGCIGAKAHLKPFIPGHTVAPIAGRTDGAVAAAPYGNGGILPISYSFIKLLGKSGLLKSAKIAILNANYLAERLKEDYKIVFRGDQGRVAHELILDCSGFKKTAGITEEDIAKRLMDYGFHAPTMSWPVVGGLMIEPTESEDKLEIDRFIDAFKQIRAEIAEIESGAVDKEDNVLKNSPHTLSHLIADEWSHSYSR